jgi:hypothetical protein
MATETPYAPNSQYTVHIVAIAILEEITTTEAMYVYPNIKKHSRNYCCRGQAIRVTYSERVSTALVIQHAKRMRLIISYTVISGLSGSTYFSIPSHTRHDFRERVIANRMRFDFVYSLLKHFSF